MKLSRPLGIVLLAIAGIIVSSYLLTVHWGWWTAVCLGVGNCELVNMSVYSEFLGLPVALWGIGAYITLLALGLALLWKKFSPWAQRGLFIVSAIGVAFSLYLTYIEVFVLREVCPWCVLSAIIVTCIAVLSALEMRAAEAELADA
ncbi:MAG: hypothetical protein HDKAJFGB_02140 [Anaerolineae bacterium]|nr:hypothetical protein [Anaerolineae bacterium]MDL1896381.1 vitamin K epoxide reductase family protein [Anaerolineae bacterium CFX7]